MTAFRKTRMRESAKVDPALTAQARDLLAADEDLDPEARAVYEEARLAGQIA
ncbi:hypothetical protein ABH935_008640 [Catenulispora sp. GAS73]|uniref:hypothetical protein n=1 Tax=Catenulispora sp. GAS73 TaxID=3156269 RepID=UPI00351185B3